MTRTRPRPGSRSRETYRARPSRTLAGQAGCSDTARDAMHPPALRHSHRPRPASPRCRKHSMSSSAGHCKNREDATCHCRPTATAQPACTRAHGTHAADRHEPVSNSQWQQQGTQCASGKGLGPNPAPQAPGSRALHYAKCARWLIGARHKARGFASLIYSWPFLPSRQARHMRSRGRGPVLVHAPASH